MLETCAVCGAEVPFKHTVHVMLNPGDDDGVVDHYVCRTCYEKHLNPLFASESADSGADGDRPDPDAREGAPAGESGGEVVVPENEAPEPED